jgi:hypothetical protein
LVHARATGAAKDGFPSMGAIRMQPLPCSAALLLLFFSAVPSLAAGTHPVRRGEVAADPQTTASITQGPDITRAGSSQKAARADLDSHHAALSRTVTAKRWDEIRNR